MHGNSNFSGLARWVFFFFYDSFMSLFLFRPYTSTCMKMTLKQTSKIIVLENVKFTMNQFCVQNFKETSRKLLRIKVTPDLHLTYSKNGGNLGLVLKMKNIACLSILLTKHVKYTYFYLFYTVL